jgi:hypothetical protein
MAKTVAAPVSASGRAPRRDNRRAALYSLQPMILAASQFYFWYFGQPTPLAPAEDRSA